MQLEVSLPSQKWRRCIRSSWSCCRCFHSFEKKQEWKEIRFRQICNKSRCYPGNIQAKWLHSHWFKSFGVFGNIQTKNVFLERKVDQSKIRYNQSAKVKQFDPPSEPTRNLNTPNQKSAKTMKGYIAEEALWKLQQCLIGFTTNDSDSRRIHDRLCTWGLG
ncbi:hypothetical protein V6N13_092680 [Hibiscus sabdariffa]